MKIKTIVYSRSFAKKLTKFSKKEQKKMLKKIRFFWDNPFIPVLKTHKLTGKLKAYWSFSLNANLRIMFKFVDETTVEFINIGGHEIYK